jgi:hypothetical protein
MECINGNDHASIWTYQQQPVVVVFHGPFQVQESGLGEMMLSIGNGTRQAVGNLSGQTVAQQ